MRRFVRGAEPTGETPLEKLWLYLTEKFGEEEAEAAHFFFLEQKRLYEANRRKASRMSRENELRRISEKFRLDQIT